MLTLNPERQTRKLLGEAGIKIDGSDPWDIHVHNPQFYKRLLGGGRNASLELGESYMDGWWDSPHLDQFFDKLLRSGIQDRVGQDPLTILTGIKARLTNAQRGKRAFEIGERHYDMGNELFVRMLGPTMAYSCAFWPPGTENITQAQANKLNRSLDKLQATPGMTLLDIGSGWGSLIRWAARFYGLDATGITVSREQKEWSERAIAQDKLEGSARARYQRWQDLPAHEQYDRIISIGAFEHFGYKNYKSFFEKARATMKDDGIMLLHTIGGHTSVRTTDPWIEKYIFPNSMIPSMEQIVQSSQGILTIKHVEERGRDYDPTLMAWHANLRKHWDEIHAISPAHYDERFSRMMDYYLLSCAGSFRAGKNQVWQIAFTKDPSIEYRLAA